MSTKRSIAVTLLCFGLFGLGVGCDAPAEPSNAAAPADAGLPPVKLNLPPAPRIVKSLIPAVHPDGTVSVYGLRQAPKSYLGKDIKVRGVVTEVYVCPWAEEEKKQEEANERARKLNQPLPVPKTDHSPCKEPYWFVADSTMARQKLLVVGWDEEKVKLPVKGQEVTLTGKLANESDRGFMSPEGLFLLANWEPFPVDGVPSAQ